MFLVKSHMEQLVNAVENCSRSIVLHMRKHDGLVSYITPLSVENNYCQSADSKLEYRAP